MNILSEFEKWAIKNNITIEHCNKENDISSNEVLKKYSNLKNELLFLKFLNCFSKFESKDQNVWFWCFNDYKNSNDTNEFTWNEFEKLSVTYAANKKEIDNIEKWWSGYLPISMSLKNGYSYLAIDLEHEIGSIVVGYEPIFEEVKKIADSFEDLIDKIVTGEIIWF